MKDKERAPYMRWVYQFFLSLFLGYYSVKETDLWKTVIAMMNPGQLIRPIIYNLGCGKTGFFYYNTQNLYGSDLVCTGEHAGENFSSPIFSSLGLPGTSVGWSIWNLVIVIFAAFSMMSFIFPDHDTAIERLLTHVKRQGVH